MREAIRGELTAAALSLVQEVGFAGTTASAIASAVGVSERTFFRYFPTKEDAVLQPIEALGAAIARELLARPNSESDFQALRRAFDVAVNEVAAEPDLMATILRVNRAEPALRRRHLQQQDMWVSDLLAALDARGGSRIGHPRARLRCSAMMLAWETALVACLEDGQFERVGQQLDQALADLQAFVGS
jgi:AcrR family transcriptional regulator